MKYLMHDMPYNSTWALMDIHIMPVYASAGLGVDGIPHIFIRHFRPFLILMMPLLCARHTAAAQRRLAEHHAAIYLISPVLSATSTSSLLIRCAAAHYRSSICVSGAHFSSVYVHGTLLSPIFDADGSLSYATLPPFPSRQPPFSHKSCCHLLTTSMLATASALGPSTLAQTANYSSMAVFQHAAHHIGRAEYGRRIALPRWSFTASAHILAMRRYGHMCRWGQQLLRRAAITRRCRRFDTG